MTEYQTQTARGHEEPYSIQFSVFLANRVGQLRELLAIFDKEDVDIYGLSIVDSTDWAVIRMVLSDPNKGRELLKRHAVPFTESEVLLIELRRQNALYEACGVLLRAEVSVHFAYPLMIRTHDNAVMVFHVDDYDLARHTLAKHGFVLPGNEDISDPGRPGA